jgi:hypothetical protein
MEFLRLELKVCEGCGALWLRAGRIDGVYCSGCSQQLVNFPPAKGRHPGGRPRSLEAVSARTASRRCAGGVQ